MHPLSVTPSNTFITLFSLLTPLFSAHLHPSPFLKFVNFSIFVLVQPLRPSATVFYSLIEKLAACRQQTLFEQTFCSLPFPQYIILFFTACNSCAIRGNVELEPYSSAIGRHICDIGRNGSTGHLATLHCN